jgi:hypothetical protein
MGELAVRAYLPHPAGVLDHLLILIPRPSRPSDGHSRKQLLQHHHLLPQLSLVILMRRAAHQPAPRLAVNQKSTAGGKAGSAEGGFELGGGAELAAGEGHAEHEGACGGGAGFGYEVGN